jgi:hypothetical protein
MTTSTVATPARTAQADAFWLRLVQITLAFSLVPLVIFAVSGTFFTTISEGDFRYAADYWYTAVGLPLALISIGHTLGVHRLQHGADGRLGTIGVWLNGLASVELFAQLTASVIQGTEVRWGPAYPVCALLSFVGVALLAAGSWRTGLLPTWLLGAWPVVWIVGGFAAKGLTPLLLAAFFGVFAVILTQRVHERAGRAAGPAVTRG